MSDSSSQDDTPRKPPAEPNGDSLDELRHLILNREQRELASLREDLEYLEKHPHSLTPDEVSDVLPDAIVRRAGQDNQLGKALAPTVEEAIQTSVKKDPQPLVDAIFPVIGPAIRKAISNALSSTIQSLNTTLEHSLSVQGLKWRIEAFRTGRSFGEVVLSHTLLYRVEQVFLIHRETGLLLQDAVSGNATVQDADMVSGMLTAIQDFVHDSFSVQDDEQLDTMQVGDLTVWIERGPHAILAAVVRGTPHQDLRVILQDAVETVHLEMEPAFHDFTGDISAFDACQPHLKSCLLVQLTEDEEDKPKSPAFWIILSATVIGLGTWSFFTIRDNWRWSDYLDRLNAEPGIVVTDTGTRDGKFYLEGLRDPLAADPRQLMDGTGLSDEDVTGVWEPYLAFLPEFVTQRAARLLKPPASAAFRFENGVLYIGGTAPKQWLADAKDMIRFMPAILRLEEDRGFLTDEMVQMLDMKALVENLTIDFPIGSSRLNVDDFPQVRTVAETIRELNRAGAVVNVPFQVEIIGHTDSTGTAAINEMISLRRANAVRDALVREGFPVSEFITRGVGATDPVDALSPDLKLQASRRVTFHVILADSLAEEGTNR